MNRIVSEGLDAYMFRTQEGRAISAALLAEMAKASPNTSAH